MIRLIKCELYKYLHLKTVLVGILSVFVIMTGLIISETRDIAAYRENEEYREELMSWQEREENLVKYAKESLTDPYYTDLQKEQIKRRIEIAEYRLEHNIEKDIYKNVWWFFNDNAFNVVFTLVLLVVILAGCINIGGEYNNKTMQQMCLLPYKRSKIVTAKLLTLLLFGGMLYAVVFVIGLLSGMLIHGTAGFNASVVLYFGANITTMNMSVYSILLVLLKLIELFFFISFAGFISFVTRSATVSTIISVLAVLFGEPISTMLSQYYNVMNYSPFTQLNFRRYLDFGTTMPAIENWFENGVVEGVTPGISFVIVMVVIVTCTISTYAVVKRQEL